MKIILMRHGRPTLKPCPSKVSPSDMHRWISDYNLSEVMDNPVPPTTRELTAQAKYIISSTMPRALTSLDRLGLKPFQTDTLFSEAELPFLHWPGLAPGFLRLRERLFFECFGSAVIHVASSRFQKHASGPSELLSDSSRWLKKGWYCCWVMAS